MGRIHPEYVRKIQAAADLTDRAWLRGGLDAMQDALRGLRYHDADPVIVAEVERLYHRQCMRVLSAQ